MPPCYVNKQDQSDLSLTASEMYAYISALSASRLGGLTSSAPLATTFSVSGAARGLSTCRHRNISLLLANQPHAQCIDGRKSAWQMSRILPMQQSQLSTASSCNAAVHAIGSKAASIQTSDRMNFGSHLEVNNDGGFIHFAPVMWRRRPHQAQAAQRGQSADAAQRVKAVKAEGGQSRQSAQRCRDAVGLACGGLMR